VANKLDSGNTILSVGIDQGGANRYFPFAAISQTSIGCIAPGNAGDFVGPSSLQGTPVSGIFTGSSC
jgi:hypothetical protein